MLPSTKFQEFELILAPWLKAVFSKVVGCTLPGPKMAVEPTRAQGAMPRP